MLEQIVSYLKKLGYTAEEQGSIEKYLIVFQKGKPLGFILSDGTLRLVSDVEGADGVRDAIRFLQENRDLRPAGNGEFLLASYRQNQVTVYYDVRDRIVRYSVCLVDTDTGEVRREVFESKDTAMGRFAAETGMFPSGGLSARKQSLSERLREKLLRYLLSRSKQQPERP